MINLLHLTIQVFIFVLIARAILSWLPVDPGHPVVRLLDRVTEPVLRPIRSVLGSTGGIDFSPMVAIILLVLLEGLLGSVLRGH